MSGETPMSDARHDRGIQPAPPSAAPTEPPPTETSPSTFAGLRPFPSNPFQSSELLPLKSPIVEVLAGALWGASIGLLIGGQWSDWIDALIGLAVGAIVGAFDGLWAAAVIGRTGELRVGTVVVAIFRILLFNLGMIVMPFAMMRWAADEDLRDR